MEFSVRINGISHAFGREFGCGCGRCRVQDRRACTSASILGREPDGTIEWHALVDIGAGVVDSLCDTFADQPARLDLLLLTHWHPDHTSELGRLLATWRRSLSRDGKDAAPASAWCRQGSADWLMAHKPSEWTRLAAQVSPGNEPPGCVLPPVDLAGLPLTINPVSLSHYSADSAEKWCCAGFVVVNETNRRKTVLLWDIDETNDWLADPMHPTASLLSNTDTLVVSCNTWNVDGKTCGKRTGHASLTTLTEYLDVLKPNRAVLVHLSGHEDGPGNPGWGWADHQWEAEAQKAWPQVNEVIVPGIGYEFPL